MAAVHYVAPSAGFHAGKRLLLPARTLSYDQFNMPCGIMLCARAHHCAFLMAVYLYLTHRQFGIGRGDVHFGPTRQQPCGHAAVGVFGDAKNNPPGSALPGAMLGAAAGGASAQSAASRLASMTPLR